MRRFISDEPIRHEMVKARVTAEEKRALQAAAQRQGVSLAELLRSATNLVSTDLSDNRRAA